VAHRVPQQYKLAALLHDADETYLNDIAGPTKYRHEMGFYREAGKRIQHLIFDKFGAFCDDYSIIKAADTEMYEMEKLRLMRPGDGDPYRVIMDEETRGVFAPFGPQWSEEAYLAAFDKYTGA
jgi:5'-deoxynucleotidase YfbR-like HD superfamily hydrolase